MGGADAALRYRPSGLVFPDSLPRPADLLPVPDPDEREARPRMKLPLDDQKKIPRFWRRDLEPHHLLL